MILGLLVFPMLAILAAAALAALHPRAAWTHLLPAVRTLALVTAATVYVAAIWSHT